MRRFWFLCVLILLMVAPVLAQDPDPSVPIIVGEQPFRLAYQAFLQGGEENRLWVLNDEGEAIEIAEGLRVNSETMDAAWSHDCSRLAFSAYAPENVETNEGSLYIYDFDSGAVSVVYESFRYLPTDLEWSPDDQWIGYRQYGEENYTIGVLNVDAGDNVVITSQPDVYLDGWLNSHAVIITLAHRIDQYTVDRRVLLGEIDDAARQLETLVENHIYVIPSPDGESLLIAEYAADGATNQLNLYTGEGAFVRKLAENVSGFYPVWSPDSRSAAYLNLNEQLFIVDTVTGQIRQLSEAFVSAGADVRGVSTTVGWANDGTSVLVNMRVSDPMAGGINFNTAIYTVAADASGVEEVIPAVSGEIGYYWYLACEVQG